MTAALRTPFTKRVGALLQFQRQRQALTQAEAAERADLSLKYVGEIERGEANVTVQALERLALVLGWDPWTLFAQSPPPMSQGVHQLLTTEVGEMLHRCESLRAWLAALDPAHRDAVSPAARPPTADSLVQAPRRRGRPPRQEGHHAPHA